MLEIVNHNTVDEDWVKNVLYDMRNSWESWEKSSDAADVELAQRLQRAGDSHGKWARQIYFRMRITASNYWWWQFDTYTVGVSNPGDIPGNSTSIMHTAGRRGFSAEDFGGEVLPEILDALNGLVDQWVANGRKRGDPLWKSIVANCPRGYLYTRGIATNYKVAREIAIDRHNHRLGDEWRTLVDFFRTLPHADKFIFNGL